MTKEERQRKKRKGRKRKERKIASVWDAKVETMQVRMAGAELFQATKESPQNPAEEGRRASQREERKGKQKGPGLNVHPRTTRKSARGPPRERQVGSKSTPEGPINL